MGDDIGSGVSEAYLCVVFDSNLQASNQIQIKTYGIHENFALLKKMLTTMTL